MTKVFDNQEILDILRSLNRGVLVMNSVPDSQLIREWKAGVEKSIATILEKNYVVNVDAVVVSG
jgi:hypothetical protein